MSAQKPGVRLKHPGLSTIRTYAHSQFQRHDPQGEQKLVTKLVAKYGRALDEDQNLCGERLLDMMRALPAPPPGPALEAQNIACLETIEKPFFRRNASIGLVNRTREYMRKNLPERHKLLAGVSSVAAIRPELNDQLERESK